MATIEEILKAIENDQPEVARSLDTNEISVPSSDGTKRYTVKFTGSPESMNPSVNTWTCDCQAGQHGRKCRHIIQASSAANKLSEMLGCE